MPETVEAPRPQRSAAIATVAAVGILLVILLAGGSFFTGAGFLFALLGIATLWLLPVLLLAAILFFVFRPMVGRQEVVRVRCRECEALNAEDDRFCAACGKPV